MFFNFESGKNGIIKSINFNIDKLDVSVKEHLQESLKKKITFVDNVAIVKCHMTFEELNKLNEAYNTFHSQFILENVISNDLMKKDTKEGE
jgi:protein-arginine kinase activator protein McsA